MGAEDSEETRVAASTIERDRATVNMRTGSAFAIAVLLSACQAAPPPESAGAPSSREPPKAETPAHCYVLDPVVSELRVLVYRDGPLARLGHNHVLVSRALVGRAAITEPGGSAAVGVRLDVGTLEVDPPAARAEEGADFVSEVSDGARAGTRANLLGEHVLDAAAYPYIDIELGSLVGPPWAPDAGVRVHLRDAVRELPVRLGVWRHGEAVDVRGSFAVTQSDLGLEPFSVLGGGLRVADDLTVRVNLHFSREDRSLQKIGSCIDEAFQPIQ